MRRRISERGNRIGTAYALTTFARVLPGRADELEAYLTALPRGSESPFARIDTLHIARVQLFRVARAPGTEAATDRCAAECSSGVHEHDRRRPGSVPGRAVRAGAGVRRVVGALRGLSGPRGRRRVPRVRARHPGAAGLFQSAMPTASVTEVRESLALREQRDRLRRRGAGAGRRARCRPASSPSSDARATRERPPPRGPGGRRSTSPTSRATSCAATRCRPPRTCSCGSCDVERARALMRRMLPQVMTAAPWSSPPGDRDERRVHVRRAA